MGGATSVLAGYTCHACSMNFSIDANGERAGATGGVLCPRCNRPAERRAAQITGSPQLFVTPSGLVMTEDTLRQLLVAQLSPAPGAQPEQVHSAIDAMLRGLRQARDGEGTDTGLFEAINRSLAEAQSQQAPPASEKIVQNLPRHKWKAGETSSKGSDECAICLNVYEEGDDICMLPCKHELHVDCLMPWLKQTNSCPLCRHQLSTDCAEYEERRRNEQQERGPGHAGRPNPIRTDAPSSAGGLPGTGRRGTPMEEFGVHTSTSSPSNASGGSSATSSPATRTRQHTDGGMRRGFLQDRGVRGFGEDRPPQQAAGSSIAGMTGIREVPREDVRTSLATPGGRLLRMPGAASGGSRSFDSGYTFSPGGLRAADAGGEEVTNSGSAARGGESDPRTWSVRKLKGVLRHARVPHDDCLEREDLVRRCLESSVDLARHSQEYDGRLVAGTYDAGATRVPRSSPLSAGAGAREWSPTTSAAASVLSSDWLGGGSASRDAMPGISGGVPARGVASDILGSPFGGRRMDSLAGRLPVQERNTAQHSYARLPPQRDRECAGRLSSGPGATEMERMSSVPPHTSESAHDSDGVRRDGGGTPKRPSSRNLYQRPNTNRQNPDDITATVSAESAAGAPRRARNAAPDSGAAASNSLDRDSSLRPGNSDPHALARPTVGASGGRRIRLRGSADSTQAAALTTASQLGAENGDTTGVRPSLSLPNARGNSAIARQSLDESAMRPGTSSVRPGSSAGLRPRAPSSSSWRPVLATDTQGSSSGDGRSVPAHGGGSGARGGSGGAGGGSEDEDIQVMPAEDPYVRLLRERDREWRGRTLQMMSGSEDDDGASLVDRYVRLGR